MFQDIAAFVFNIELLQTWGLRLLDGLCITVEVVGISCGIGFVLSYPIARARMSRNPLIYAPATAYVFFFRGTPLLCQLYLTYYGAGEIRPLLSSLNLWWFFRDAFYCCILAFAMNTGAYQGEIVRGALQAIPRGQIEAARSLGLSPYRINRHIVFPQAMLIALRPLGNELISIVKASALAAIVTLLDLMGQTRFIFARTFDFSIYFYAALIYLGITETIARVWDAIERYLSRHLLAGLPVATLMPQTKSAQLTALDPLRAAH